MEIVIALLKEAIKQYESGTVNVGDTALYTAIKIRKESDKAQKLISQEISQET